MTITGQVAVPLSHALREQGFQFQTETALQVLTTAVSSTGVRSYEEANQLGVPFVIDKPPARGMYRHSEPILDRGAVIARIESILLKQEQRGQRTPTDETSRYIDALKAATTVIEHVKASGLCVYVQKLMFSVDYELVVADRLLAAMYDKTLKTTSACVAVAAGQVAPLPTRRLKDHLKWLAAKPVLFGKRGETLAAWVDENHPYVVEFPAPDIKAGKTSRLDHFNKSGPHEAAELGLGFFLLAIEPEPLGYTVVTPLMFNRQLPAGPGTGPWRGEFHRKVHRPKWHDGEQLRTLLQMRKRHGIVQLDACPHCAEIYVVEGDKRLRPDLSGQCACGQ